MKRVFTTMLFLFVVQCGWSQIEMKLKPHNAIQNTDSTVFRKFPFLHRNSQVINLDSSRFSHLAAGGLVYTLAQDNMPCLKPNTDVVYNMPVQTLSVNDNMPNAYQQPQRNLLQSLRKQFLDSKK